MVATAMLATALAADDGYFDQAEGQVRFLSRVREAPHSPRYALVIADPVSKLGGHGAYRRLYVPREVFEASGWGTIVEKKHGWSYTVAGRSFFPYRRSVFVLLLGFSITSLVGMIRDRLEKSLPRSIEVGLLVALMGGVSVFSIATLDDTRRRAQSLEAVHNLTAMTRGAIAYFENHEDFDPIISRTSPPSRLPRQFPRSAGPTRRQGIRGRMQPLQTFEPDPVWESALRGREAGWRPILL